MSPLRCAVRRPARSPSKTGKILLATPAQNLAPGSVPLNRDYVFENFVVGRPNAVAAAEARRVAEADFPAANPLLLFGGTGLGKSHLMQSVAWRILERNPAKRILHITAGWFLGNLVAATKVGDMTAFKPLVRHVDVLCVDDFHFIAGNNATTEEFLYAFNTLADAGKQIILTSDRSLLALAKLSDQVRSRLLKGMSVEIAPSDFDLRLAILEAKAACVTREHPDFIIGREGLRFMAQRINANTRQLEGALNRVRSHSMEGVQPVDLANLQLWLADFPKFRDRRVTIDEIKVKTAAFHARKVGDLESQSRAREFVRPRQIAMFLARRMTTRSLPEIARRFNRKDHTTVLHAVKTVAALAEADSEFASKLDELRRSIRDWPIEPPEK